MSKNLLRMPKVEEKTGYKRASIWRKVKDGSFPRPVHLSKRATAWVEDEVDGWIARHIAAREETTASEMNGAAPVAGAA
jgi:prophage regulatory protein